MHSAPKEPLLRWSGVERFFRKSLDIREGEGSRAALMVTHIFLLISALMIVKPVVNAMFLTRFGVSRLPFVFILVALFAGAASRYYSILLKSHNLYQLIDRTLCAMIGSLLLFWALVHWRVFQGWALFAFYVWIAVFSLLSTSQFWILANTVFNPREAKRLFGFIGAGAIAGGIFGGYLVKFSAGAVGSENLLWICAVCLIGCLPIPRMVRHKTASEEVLQKNRQEEHAGALSQSPLKLIRNSRHLSLLAGIIGVSVVVGKLVEYQFSAIALSELTDTDQLSAFFGFWLSNLNIVSFLIQLLITRRVVGAFGVGVSLFFLPSAILFGALAVLVHPALWSAVLIKICDGSLKNSINKAGIELLVLPVPVDVKHQAKTYIDVFIDSLSTGLGGMLLLLFTLAFGMTVRQISLVILLLLGFWIYLVVLVQKEYIRSFRLKLAAHPLQTDPPTDRPNDRMFLDRGKESIIDSLLEALSGDSDDKILKALRMTPEIRNDRFVPIFLTLLDHPSSAVRLEVLKNLYLHRKTDHSERVKKHIRDPDLEVRTEAMHYLFQHSGFGRVEMLQDFLRRDDDDAVRSAALLCAAGESRRNNRLKRTFEIRSRIETQLKELHRISDQGGIDFIKILSARVIGTANIPELYPYLHILLNDPSPQVLKAAILGAGETRRKEFLPVLIPHLAVGSRQKTVAEAFNFHGPPVLDLLSAYLDNRFVAREIRCGIPLAISLMGVQKSADLLMKHLRHQDLSLRYAVIRALNHLRIHFPDLNFDDRSINRSILEEAQDHLNMLSVLYRQARETSASSMGEKPASPWSPADEARQGLTELLEKRLDDALERIFRLLGLKYPPQDIYDVYQNLYSNASDLRTNAVEFLDNFLEPDLKKVIIPIIETSLINPVIDQAMAQLDLKVPGEYECLAMILSGGDSALQIQALELIGRLGSERFPLLIGGLINSPDPCVRQAAREALKNIGYPM